MTRNGKDHVHQTLSTGAQHTRAEGAREAQSLPVYLGAGYYSGILGNPPTSLLHPISQEQPDAGRHYTLPCGPPTTGPTIRSPHYSSALWYTVNKTGMDSPSVLRLKARPGQRNEPLPQLAVSREL